MANRIPAVIVLAFVSLQTISGQEYAVNNPTAVVGQPVTVVDESAQTVSLYLVGFNGLIGFDGGSGVISSPDVDTIRVMDRTDYEVLPESERNNTRILYFLRG